MTKGSSIEIVIEQHMRRVRQLTNRALAIGISVGYVIGFVAGVVASFFLGFGG